MPPSKKNADLPKKHTDLKSLDWFSLQQAGELLQLSPKTVGRRCMDKTIPAIKFGSLWRISRETMDRLRQEG